MFILKKKYFLLIENIKDIDLENIKIRNKFSIIYRNNKNIENITNLLKFRKICKLKSIKFYIANNISLAIKLNSDGIYLSAYNKNLKSLSFKKKNFNIIGSAHNIRELSIKKIQKCDYILFSKLFLVEYDKKAPYLGVIKFNNLLTLSKNLIPLGGINTKNIHQLKNINCKGFALLSEIKKKPTNIISRLF